MLFKLNKSKTDRLESVSISFDDQTVIQMVNIHFVFL